MFIDTFLFGVVSGVVLSSNFRFLVKYLINIGVLEVGVLEVGAFNLRSLIIEVRVNNLLLFISSLSLSLLFLLLLLLSSESISLFAYLAERLIGTAFNPLVFLLIIGEASVSSGL